MYYKYTCKHIQNELMCKTLQPVIVDVVETASLVCSRTAPRETLEKLLGMCP